MEDSFPDTRFRYLCAEDGGELRAVLPVYDRHAPTAPNTLTKLVPPTSPTRARFAHRILRRLPLSVLIAGSPYSYRSDVIGDPACTGPLTDALLELARAQGIDLLSFLYLRRPIRLPGSLTGHCIDDFVLDLPGSAVDDYVASFRRKKTRYQLRRAFRECPELVSRPLSGHGPLLSELGFITASRHGPAEAVPPSLYERLARHLDGSARVLLAGPEGARTAALAIFESGDELDLFHIGVRDRDRTYFDICFTQPIRRAYELGVERVNFRPAGGQAKTLRGCRRVPTHYCILPLTARARGSVRVVRALAGGGAHG